MSKHRVISPWDNLAEQIITLCREHPNDAHDDIVKALAFAYSKGYNKAYELVPVREDMGR